MTLLIEWHYLLSDCYGQTPDFFQLILVFALLFHITTVVAHVTRGKRDLILPKW